MYLFVVRHGEPIYGPDTLTERGFKQAEALVKRFKIHGLDKIYVSPNGRAQDTARPTAQALGLDFNIEPWMSEDPAWRAFNVPDGKGGLTWSYAEKRAVEMMDEKYAKMDTNEVIKSDLFVGAANPEYYNEIAKRSDELLARHGYVREGRHYICNTDKNERIAAFCHGGFSGLWFSHLTQIPLHIFTSLFERCHSGVTCIYFDTGAGKKVVPYFISVNDMGHLMDADTPYEGNANYLL